MKGMVVFFNFCTELEKVKHDRFILKYYIPHVSQLVNRMNASD